MIFSVYWTFVSHCPAVYNDVQCTLCIVQPTGFKGGSLEYHYHSHWDSQFGNTKR